MSNPNRLDDHEFRDVLNQITNTESGEIDKKLVKNRLHSLILHGNFNQMFQILMGILANDRPKPLQQLIE
jgi:hypothetical protein